MFRSVEVRDPDRRCRHCKYSLEGLGRGGGVKCPECGNVVSDDDLLGVRRFAGPGEEFLWACCVPLLGAAATTFSALMSLVLDQDAWWLGASMVCALFNVLATMLSLVIGTIVHVIRRFRAPAACRLLITNRCLAAVLGHIAIVLAMLAWVWRCMNGMAGG